MNTSQILSKLGNILGIGDNVIHRKCPCPKNITLWWRAEGLFASSLLMQWDQAVMG